MLGGEVVANVRQHRADLVRFDGQHEDIGELGHLGVGCRCLRSNLFGERGAGGFARVAGDNLAGREESGPNKARARAAAIFQRQENR